MISIYHNPRCSKSREALQILEENSSNFKVIKYLEDTFDQEALENVISLLGIKPIELIRKNESIWKEEYKDLNLSDKDLIAAMVKHPKLIERPIVVNGKKAIIGRPPQNILNIL
ncbi:arsenate reductase (glutaredoxin) [Gelidibacter sp. F2691]|nr:arsenate reductase (glutaredoxin) [Gelidibacter sp. F2691]